MLKLVVAAATVGLLWLAWTSLVAKMLVTPQREAHAKAYHGLGWFGRLKGGPTAAIAARSMTYWGRDPRYWISLVMIPVVPVFVIVALTLVYELARRLYNRRVAIATVLVLLLTPMHPQLHPLIMARQVLAEVPMFGYLLAGYLCFFFALGRSRWMLVPAIICWAPTTRARKF